MPAPDNAGTEALHLDQTRAYLVEWLSRQPDAPDDAFSEEEIRRIHQVSGGRPDRIKQLARQGLTDPARRRRRWPVPLAAGVAAVLIVAVAAFVVFRPAPEQTRQGGLEIPPGATVAAGGTQPAVNKSNGGKASPAAGTERKTPGRIAGIRDGEWLRDVDEDHYVLQLISAVESDTIHNFVRHAELPGGELTLLLTGRDGKLWFVLVYGLYPDAETARRQRRKLTDYARLQKPWPRRVGSVLEEAIWPQENR